MRQSQLYIIILLFLCAVSASAVTAPDVRSEMPIAQDSIVANNTVVDTMRQDSTRRPSMIRRVNVDLDNPVELTATDSMIMTGNNDVYLYGKGVVTYGDIKLDADQIKLMMDSSIVHAMGSPDSLGELIGTPIFQDKSGEYASKTMRYNFKSER